MPPSSQLPEQASTVTVAQTQTKTSTKAKVIALSVGLFALGLAAYGFGFIPGLDTAQIQPPQQEELRQELTQETSTPEEVPGATTESPATRPLDCLMTCEENHRSCLGVSTPIKCDDVLHECERACPGDAVTPPTPSQDQPTSSSQTASASQCLFTIEHTDSIGMTTNDMRVLVPNNDWQVLNRYMLNAGGEDVAIHQFGLVAEEGFSHFQEIGLMRDGVLIGRLPAAGPSSIRDFPLFETLRIPGGTSIHVQLVARLASITPRADDPTFVPLTSGDRVGLSIGSGNIGGMWNRTFENRYLVDAECQPSSERAYAPGSSSARPFIIRKAFLRLSQEPLSTTTLTDGRQSIYRFHALSEGGETSLKKVVFTYKYQGADSGTYVGDVRLFKGSTEMRAEEYRITDQFGRDLRSLPLSPNSREGMFVIVFTSEERISPAGQSYTLSAQFRSPQIGSFLQVAPLSDARPGLSTGFLTADGARGSFNGIAGPTIDEQDPADGVPDAGAGVIWSDLSATPHMAREGQMGGSRDWIAGSLDNQLNLQILSR